jgi:hypothetical protein
MIEIGQDGYNLIVSIGYDEILSPKSIEAIKIQGEDDFKYANIIIFAPPQQELGPEWQLMGNASNDGKTWRKMQYSMRQLG